MNTPRVPPRFVPTLTEVVEFDEPLVLDEAALAPVEPPLLVSDPEPVQAYAPVDPFAQAANTTHTPPPSDVLVDWQQPVPDLALDAAVDQLQQQAPVTEPDFQSVATLLTAVTEPAYSPEPVVFDQATEAITPAPSPAPFPSDSPVPSPASAGVVADDVPAFLLSRSPAPAWAPSEPAAPVQVVAPEPAQATALSDSSAAPAGPAELAPVAQLDAEREEQIVQNVLIELQRRADLMLEYRLRESLTPILARLCDSLIKEARQDLATTLRDVVARAVAQELTRHRPK
jgi:hypothetical protein